MIVPIGGKLTPISQVSQGDIIFNTGGVVVYVDTIQANVIAAPNSTATPVNPGASIQWAGSPGLLYGVDPSNSGLFPGIGVTAQTGLPFPAPVGGPQWVPTPQGLLFYVPFPGFGNLRISAAASVGTDQYGNGIKAGLTVYDGAGGSVSVQGSLLKWMDDNGHLWQAGAFLDSLSNPYLGFSYAGSVDNVAWLSTAGFLHPNKPGSNGVVETANSIVPNAGWSVNVSPDQPFRYEMTNAGKVKCHGLIKQIAGTPSATIATLPAAYAPSIAQFGASINDNNAAVFFGVDTSGNLTISPLAGLNLSTYISFEYPLQ